MISGITIHRSRNGRNWNVAVYDRDGKKIAAATQRVDYSETESIITVEPYCRVVMNEHATIVHGLDVGEAHVEARTVNSV